MRLRTETVAEVCNLRAEQKNSKKGRLLKVLATTNVPNPHSSDRNCIGRDQLDHRTATMHFLRLAPRIAHRMERSHDNQPCLRLSGNGEGDRHPGEEVNRMFRIRTEHPQIVI